MSNGLSISLSGIQSALRRLDIAANNIANLNTPGFQAQRGDFAETVDEAGASQDAGARADASNNVNLADEQVNLLTSEVSVRANINAIRAQDEIFRQLLDATDTQD